MLWIECFIFHHRCLSMSSLKDFIRVSVSSNFGFKVEIFIWYLFTCLGRFDSCSFGRHVWQYRIILCAHDCGRRYKRSFQGFCTFHVFHLLMKPRQIYHLNAVNVPILNIFFVYLLCYFNTLDLVSSLDLLFWCLTETKLSRINKLLCIFGIIYENKYLWLITFFNNLGRLDASSFCRQILRAYKVARCSHHCARRHKRSYRGLNYFNLIFSRLYYILYFRLYLWQSFECILLTNTCYEKATRLLSALTNMHHLPNTDFIIGRT